MRLLVAGGAGFIGSNFIRHMLSTNPDCRILNFDKLTYAGNLANLRAVEASAGYSFVQGDIADRKVVAQQFDSFEPTAVVNFAAESHVDRSILDASAFVETNIKGTQVLLEVVRSYPVERFVQISTDEVYGTLGEEGAFTEKSQLAPNNPYAASKAAADLLARAYHKAYDLPIVITRSSNNYGPYQFPEKLIPLMIRNALNEKELPVYGEGKQVRDWLYVDDNCRALELVLQKGRIGEVYNIGGCCEKQNLEIVRRICSTIASQMRERRSSKASSQFERLITHIPDPRGAAHDFRYALDSTVLRSELGWEPRVGLEEGLARTVAWYLDNQDWVENVITGEYQKYYESVYGTRQNEAHA